MLSGRFWAVAVVVMATSAGLAHAVQAPIRVELRINNGSEVTFLGGALTPFTMPLGPLNAGQCTAAIGPADDFYVTVEISPDLFQDPANPQFVAASGVELSRRQEDGVLAARVVEARLPVGCVAGSPQDYLQFTSLCGGTDDNMDGVFSGADEDFNPANCQGAFEQEGFGVFGEDLQWAGTAGDIYPALSFSGSATPRVGNDETRSGGLRLRLPVRARQFSGGSSFGDVRLDGSTDTVTSGVLELSTGVILPSTYSYQFPDSSSGSTPRVITYPADATDDDPTVPLAGSPLVPGTGALTLVGFGFVPPQPNGLPPAQFNVWHNTAFALGLSMTATVVDTAGNPTEQSVATAIATLLPNYDGDGSVNAMDSDDDNDGIPDDAPVAGLEGAPVTDAVCGTAENQNVEECLGRNVERDFDEDACGNPEDDAVVTNYRDADTDDDGLCDGNAAAVAGVCQSGEDDDVDGCFEIAAQETNPIDADTDDDGLCDGDRTVGTTCGYGEDRNRDGLATGETSPIDPDTDDDGLCDGNLTGGGACLDGEDRNVNGFGAGETNPLDPDTDEDGLCDGNLGVAGACFGGENLDGGAVAANETNPLDADSDNDGLCDGNGAVAGTCFSGENLDGGTVAASETNPLDADSDNDGLCDGNLGVAGTCLSGENLNGGAVTAPETNPLDADSDNDGLCDGNGAVAGTCFSGENLDGGAVAANETNPLDADSDDDGLCDGNLGVGGTCFGGENLDGGGVSATETFPLDPDSDDDGLCDGDRSVGMICGYGENRNGGAVAATETNPRLADTDGDGLCDGQGGSACTGNYGEDRGNDGVRTNETNPILADTDSDGLCDGQGAGSACTGNYGEDRGNDGVRTNETNPLLADSDGDGLCDGNGAVVDICLDGEDRNVNGFAAGESNPLDVDTDDDGLCDGDRSVGVICGYGENRDGAAVAATETDPADADTDDDGLCDGDRSVAGICAYGEDRNRDGLAAGETSPIDPDTDNDGLCDGDRGVSITCALGEDLDRDGLYLNDTDSLHPLVGGTPGADTSPLLADSDMDGLCDGPDLAGSPDPGDECTGEDYDADALYLNDGDVAPNTDPRTADTDGDGLCDGAVPVSGSCALGEDPDADRVYLSDAEYPSTDPRTADSDMDGLCDGGLILGVGGPYTHLNPYTNPLGAEISWSCAFGEDLDRDGVYLTDPDSPHPGPTGFVLGPDSDPRNADTDGDGLCDGVSLGSNTTPNENPAGAQILWSCAFGEDLDRDGLYLADTDSLHEGLGGPDTDPRNADTDADRLCDGRIMLQPDGITPYTLVTPYTNAAPSAWSCAYGEDLDRDGDYLAENTDPRDPDTDGDALCDGPSIPMVCTGEDLDGDGLDAATETNPRNSDTDGDGVLDGPELDAGLLPLDPDSDGAGAGDGYCDGGNTVPAGCLDEECTCIGGDNCPAILNNQGNADGDPRGDACDNCAFEPNVESDGSQLDADMDGVGNVCQCGDVSGANGSPDGVVDATDRTAVEDHLDGAVLLDGIAREKCSVVGVTGPCEVADLTALTNFLADPPTGVLAQICRPAVCLTVAGANFDEDCAADVADSCPTIPNALSGNAGCTLPGVPRACCTGPNAGTCGPDDDMDGVNHACDTCLNQANATFAPSVNRTFVSGQRDDDADGRGNSCDFDYNNAGAVVAANDFNDMKFSLAGLMTLNTCGGSFGGTCDLDLGFCTLAPALACTANSDCTLEGGSGPEVPNQRCGEFDHDEPGPTGSTGAVVTAADFNLTKAAVGKVINTTFPKCTACARPYSCELSNVVSGPTLARVICIGPACVEIGQPDPCAPPPPGP